MQRYDHLPTVEAALAAQAHNGLHESYWWVTGWNFNRPIIGQIGIGVVLREAKSESYVWLRAGDNCPAQGWKASELEGIPFVLVGPIECPHGLFISAEQRALLVSLVRRLRLAASRGGHLHSYWEMIFDIEAMMAGHATIVKMPVEKWIAHVESELLSSAKSN